MTMEDLYEHMKAAMRNFDLQWGQMDKVKVTIEGSNIHFEHEGLRITILGNWK